jgi:hypothetical protein
MALGEAIHTFVILVTNLTASRKSVFAVAKGWTQLYILAYGIGVAATVVRFASGDKSALPSETRRSMVALGTNARSVISAYFLDCNTIGIGCTLSSDDFFWRCCCGHHCIWWIDDGRLFDGFWVLCTFEVSMGI